MPESHPDIFKVYLARKRNHQINNDGWGVAYYLSTDSSSPPSRSTDPLTLLCAPLTSKAITAIADSTELLTLVYPDPALPPLKSYMFFAHARAASHGKVDIHNCHPFTVAGGCMSFMHSK